MGRDRSRSGRKERSRERTERKRGGSRERRDRSRSGGRDRRDRSGDRGRKKEEKEEEKEAKLEYKAGAHVIVKGLAKNPEKNGAMGSLVEFNKEKSRWVVAFASGGQNNFKEENLELMPDNSDVVDDTEEPPTAKIYITGLPAETKDQDLIDLFAGVGMIDKEKPKGRAGFKDTWPWAVKLYKPGKDQGDGCVTFVDAYAAKAAIKTYNRTKFKGSKITVAYAGQGMKFDPAAATLQLPWHLREENKGKLDKDGAGGGGDGGKEKRPGDWNCPGCGADVYASKSSCFKCGEAKPGGDGGGGGKDSGGKGGKAGDWTCSGCGANVFANKSSCFKCGTAKSGGGGGGGYDGGKGGGKGGKEGKAGDWTCKCGANVFASKDTCFKCGEWKPRS